MVRFTSVARAALIGLTLFAVLPAFAVDVGEALADPKLEARARSLSTELRCLVCQNQSIDDSNAPLAKDLRRLVRERISAGDSDRAVMSYIVDRYGEFVLLRPPFGLHTLLLWATPALVLALTVGMIMFRRRTDGAMAADVTPALSADEQRALDKLLKRDG